MITTNTVLAQFIVGLKEWNTGLKKAESVLKKSVDAIRSRVSEIPKRIDAIGGRMVEQAERYTFLAGAIFAPIVLSMKNFADQNEELRGKLKDLYTTLQQTPQWDFAKKNRIAQQIVQFQQMEFETRKARFQQEKISLAFKDLQYQIGRLLWEGIGPYIPKLIEVVKLSILWIKTNQETVKNIIVLVAKFGALMLVLAPTVTIVGKVIRVFAFMTNIFSLLLSPIGLIIVALTGLYLLFKDALDPVFSKHMEQVKALWEAWRTGQITTEEALGKLTEQLKTFAWDFLLSVNTKIDEWTGGINQVVEDFFTNMLILFDKGYAMIKGWWDKITGVFSWGYDKISNIMGSLRNMFDQAIGHSWWTDSMVKMRAFAINGFGGAADVIVWNADRIRTAIGGIHGALNAIPKMASFNRSAMGYSYGGVSNTYNIGVNGGALAASIRSAVQGTVQRHVLSVIRNS